MTESNPERIPGVQELTEMLNGPMNDQSEAEMLTAFHRDALAAYSAAEERKDERAIDDAEARLAQLYEAHPELRDEG